MSNRPTTSPSASIGLLQRCLLALALSNPAMASTDSEQAVQERLKSCDPQVSLAAAEEVLNDPKAISEPVTMFSPAHFLFLHGRKDDAVFWFYAAQLRFRYQAAIQQGDYGQVLSIVLMTVGPAINNYAFQDTAKLSSTIDRVLAWDKATPNPLRDLAKSKDATIRLDQVYVGINELKAKLAAEKETLESAARLAAPQVQQLNQQAYATQCGEDNRPTR